MSKVKCFVHTDLDGVGCAILAYLAFGRENVDVEYCDYKDVDEKVREFYLCNDKPYDYIFITDISIDEENAQEIDSWIARDKVRLFDHHATALWLNKYDWCDVKVTLPVKKSVNDHSAFIDDVKTSGTELFYNYLTYHAYICPGNFDSSILDNIKRFVEIVRDYDTWRWKDELGEEGIVCKQVNDLFYIYGRDEFIAWVLNNVEKYGPNVGVSFPFFTAKDEALLNHQQKDIDIYVEQKDKQLAVFMDYSGREYGVVFAERYFSELGNRLCELHPELAYIAMIDICSGKISYRTIRDDIDLGGEIAHSLGGGGHRKAAGNTFDANDIQETVLTELFSIW